MPACASLRALAAAAEAEGLVDRYQDLVETYHHHFEAQHEEVEGCPVLDLSALEIAILTDRLSTPPMETLAASRGLRQAVAGRPGLQPPGVLRLGNYRCVLSFDRMPQAAYPYALHLSVRSRHRREFMDCSRDDLARPEQVGQQALVDRQIAAL